MSFIYCKTTSNPLISTFVNKLMIYYHSLIFFCEIVCHFGFYPPKNPPIIIQSKQIWWLGQTLYKTVVQTYFGKEFVLGFFLTLFFLPDYTVYMYSVLVSSSVRLFARSFANSFFRSFVLSLSCLFVLISHLYQLTLIYLANFSVTDHSSKYLFRKFAIIRIIIQSV